MTSWPFGDLRPLSFDLIMLDCPWSHLMRSEKGVTEKSAGGQYRTMSIEDIAALPVAALARGDAIVWTWATHAMIDQQIEVTRKWGLNFSTTGVWVKTTKNGKLAFGTGQRLRCASEPFIISTVGAPLTAKNVRTAFLAPIARHSEKPDEAYEIASALYPGAIAKADIFSRRNRPGWTAFGDEAGKFDGEAA